MYIIIAFILFLIATVAISCLTMHVCKRRIQKRRLLRAVSRSESTEVIILLFKILIYNSMIAYEIQLWYVIRDKIQSERKILSEKKLSEENLS